MPNRVWHGTSYKFVNPKAKKIRLAADDKIIFENDDLFDLQVFFYLINNLYRINLKK